jgi:hypothetical protein
MQHDFPHRRGAERGARYLVILSHRPKYLPLRDLRRDGPEIEPVLYPARTGTRCRYSLKGLFLNLGAGPALQVLASN